MTTQPTDNLLVPEIILLDLDGTMVDSAPDLSFCVNTMLSMLGIEERPGEQIRAWIGNGTDRLIHRALTGEKEGIAAASLFATAKELFEELYDVHNGEYSQVYPGVPEGLGFLSSVGYRLGCVTNKPVRFTEPLLEKLGLIDYFDLVLGGDSLARKKPDPLPLLYAAEYFQAEPQQSLLIGDSITDVKAARAAEFNIVAVSYGYNHGQNIALARPDAIIDSLTELSELLSPVPVPESVPVPVSVPLSQFSNQFSNKLTNRASPALL